MIEDILFIKMEFNWSEQEEPHKSRRLQILAKYPEIKKLMGHDTNLVWKVTFLVVLQTISAWFIKDQSWYVVLLIAYMWGGIWNHSLALAIHEISHNLAFGYSYPALNRLLGIFSNLPLGIPVSITFRKYHLEHHKYQGDEILDVDLPSELEAKLFRGSFLKAVWLVLQPLFYAFRPVLCHPKMPNYWDFLNLIVQLAFDFLVYKYMGLTSLIYLLSCTLLSMGLHPMAGHFVSEHYLLSPGQETFSYYGILNKVAFNVGFHNEHHDFPNIPGSRLPQVKEIAPEFYDSLLSHTSWTAVLYKFITDPNVNLFCRIKRKHKTQ